ncbi:glycosyl hydrolase family 10-domain-containing protein [Neocallimastix lanati (nom. inval.)]|nr:glycosyl hydrolase family 10-domain-containing protein [Neocallimastix sp. JGI-2020a]
MREKVLYIHFLLMNVSVIYSKCWSESLGYKCCSLDIEPIFTDNDGIWGMENEQWCGIINKPSLENYCENDCCKNSNLKVSYVDNNGYWGIESESWCKINFQNKNDIKNCWSLDIGYGCCSSNNTDILYNNEDGSWGIENGQWCGIVNSMKIDENSIPKKPSYMDAENFDDPAKNCNITDSIIGDSLKQYAPFRMGVGINGSLRKTSTILSKKMVDIINHQFNSVTLTNLMKPSYLLDQNGSQKNIMKGIQDPSVNFQSAIDTLEYCKKNNIKMRGHTLVWHTQTPSWFFKKDYDDKNDYVDSEVMELRIESYIKQVMQFVQYYYPGVVDVWDVVNEAVEIDEGYYDEKVSWKTRTKCNESSNPWYETMGPDYVIKAFRFARKYAAPGVKLIYNDYNTFMSEKTTAIINLLKILKEENLIDGIGMQSYLTPTFPERSTYANAIKKFGELGIEVQITELTISIDDKLSEEEMYEKQAEQYKEVFEIYLKAYHNGINIGSVTVFGLQDGYLFYTNDSTKTRLWDKDLQKKKNYYSILEVLKEYYNKYN